MVKKIFTGAIAAAITVTSVLTVSPTATSKSRTNTDMDLGQNEIEYDLEATNSLGKYFKKISEGTEAEASLKNLSNNSDLIFEINSLDYNAETGVVTVYSSQAEKCYVLFSVVDEDTNEAVQKYKCEVNAGKCVITEKAINTKELPEYFTIEANLIDKNDKVLSDTFHYDFYTKIHQEIAAATVHDFNETQVVNFDESENTNFIVLSDDTVKADSSENENTLVSADYDNDVFVFDNIGESMQYLQRGDFFYVQPDDENVIAIKVDEINVEGDTATIKGNDDIDDMLAFVKFETVAGMDGATVDVSDATEGFEYLGHENEQQFTLDEDKPIEFNYVQRKPVSVDASASASLTFDGQEAVPDVKDFPLSLSGIIKFSAKLNFCKKWGYTSVKLTINPSITLKFSANAKHQFEGADSKSKKIEDFKNKLNEASKKALSDPLLGKLFDINIPTQIPMVAINTSAQFKFTVSGEVSISVTYSPEFGFCANSDGFYDKKTGKKKTVEGIAEFGADKIKVEQTIKGTLFFGLIISPKIVLINEKVVSAGLTFTAGFQLTVKQNVEPTLGYDTDSDFYQLSDNGYAAIYDSNVDYIHSCEGCFYGNVDFICKLEFKIKLLNKDAVLDASLFNITVPISALDFYFILPIPSLMLQENNNLGFRKDCYIEGEKKTCPHYKYKTTFTVTDEQKNPLQGVSVLIDGLSNSTNADGYTQFYCNPGTYAYKVTYGKYSSEVGKIEVKRIVDDKVNNSQEIVLKLERKDDGSVNVLGAKAGANGNEGYVPTTTTTTTTTAPVSTTTTAFVEKKEDEMLEAMHLGDNVWGILYPDGYMLVFGHGDMYPDLNEYSEYSPFNNVKEIKTVVFEDTDPANGEYITSICNDLFNGAVNLETVYLSNEITKIGNRAFKDCQKLKYFRYGGEDDTSEKLVLPSQIQSIGKKAFENCEAGNFSNIVFGSEVKFIGDYAFSNCPGITSVTVENDEAILEKYVFYNCQNNETATFKNVNGRIGSGTLRNNYVIKELTIGSFDSLYDPDANDKDRKNAIGIGSIANCDYKKDLVYETHVDYYFPSSLKTISVMKADKVPYREFYKMSQVKEIILPEGVEVIEGEAFYNCTNVKLDASNLLKNVEKIGSYAFYNCSSIEFGDLKFSDNLKEIKWYAFANCPGITSVTIEGEDAILETYVFANCKNITKATFKNVNGRVGSNVLANNVKLEELTIGSFDSLYDPDRNDVNNKLYLILDRIVPCNSDYPKNLKKINVLKANVIPSREFYGMKSLEEVNIPKEISIIESEAFYNCSGLKKIHFSDKLELVDEYAFDGCNAIEEVIYDGTEGQWYKLEENGIMNHNDPILRKKSKAVFVFDQKEYVAGDANGDGAVDMSDVVLIMQCLASPNKYGVNGSEETHITERGIKFADADGNGLTVNDALRIQEFLLGKIDSIA